MPCKFLSSEVLFAGLALYNNCRTFPLNMLKQLLPGHILKLRLIANVTPEFRTLIYSMPLKVCHSPPDGFHFAIHTAIMRKFTEINHVFKNLV